MPRTSIRLLGALALMLPFLAVADTFFVSDDLQMWLFGATAYPAEISWLPSSRWTWHRPLPALSWIVNYRLAGDAVFWWHLPNVLVHLASVSLAWALGKRLSDSNAIGVVTALLFAWSPAAPGTVSWISARPDLLVTTFSLAALCCAYSLRLRTRPWVQALLVALFVLLAISSKESAFGLLPICLLLTVAPRLSRDAPSCRWQLDIRFALIIAAILMAYIAVRLMLYGPSLGGYGTPLSARRLITSPLLTVPSLFAPLRITNALGAAPRGVFVLLLGAAATVWLLRRAPLWTLAALSAVLPAAHLISASVPAWEYDRFYYLASFWLAGGIATVLVEAWTQGRRHAATIVGSLLFLCEGTYLTLRAVDLRRASQVAEDVDATLRRHRPHIPPGSLVLCDALPDSIREAYAYRNGCEEHIRMVWRSQEVIGTRSGTARQRVGAYAFTADGTTLYQRGRE